MKFYVDADTLLLLGLRRCVQCNQEGRHVPLAYFSHQQPLNSLRHLSSFLIHPYLVFYLFGIIPQAVHHRSVAEFVPALVSHLLGLTIHVNLQQTFLPLRK
jgi:hypothetical protein